MSDIVNVKQNRKNKVAQDDDGMASRELFINSMTTNKSETNNEFPKFKFQRNHSKTNLKPKVQTKEQEKSDERIF